MKTEQPCGLPDQEARSTRRQSAASTGTAPVAPPADGGEHGTGEGERPLEIHEVHDGEEVVEEEEGQEEGDEQVEQEGGALGPSQVMDTQEYLAEAEEMLGTPLPPGATVVVTTTGTPAAVRSKPCCAGHLPKVPGIAA